MEQWLYGAIGSDGHSIDGVQPYMRLGDLYRGSLGTWYAKLEVEHGKVDWCVIGIDMPYLHPVDNTVWIYAPDRGHWVRTTKPAPRQSASKPEHYGGW